MIVPCIGTATCPLPATAAPPPPAARRGRAAAGAPPPDEAATGAAPSGTQSATEYLRPLTSTSTSRRTLGSPSSAAGAPGDDSTPDRSSVSSTHLVECFAAAKSGCERI